MELDKLWIDDTEENDFTHPMGIAVLDSMLPSVATKILVRRFGLDGKPTMSTEDVAKRYGLTIGIVQNMLSVSVNMIADMGLDLTTE